MNIKVGDQVKFLNDPGGGKVVKIIGDQAYVIIEDGFEVPTLLSNLIKDQNQSYGEGTIDEVDEPYVKQSQQSTSVLNETEDESEVTDVIVAEYSTKFNPILAFVLSDKEKNLREQRIDICLINDGNYFLSYVIAFSVLNKHTLIEKGELEPEMLVKVGTFGIDQLLENQALSISIIPYNKKAYQFHKPLHVLLDWETLNITSVQSFVENEYFDEKAYVVDLVEFETAEMQREKLATALPRMEISKKNVKKQIIDLEEVDLHIDKLVSAEQLEHMTAGQILEAQLARFTIALEGAIKAGTKRIVFIHGVGNGKLRYEIQKTLNRKYPHLTYQDASFAEYGYGATMVILRK